MGTIGFLIPKNMDIDIKIVTLALLEANLWPNMWFRWRPFWMCHKTRLRGGKNWTPIFLAYLTPNEAIKTIKSILATEMAKMTYRTRLYVEIWFFLCDIDQLFFIDNWKYSLLFSVVYATNVNRKIKCVVLLLTPKCFFCQRKYISWCIFCNVIGAANLTNLFIITYFIHYDIQAPWAEYSVCNMT